MVNLVDALDSIQSERVKERDSGIANLKHLLKVNQKSPELNNFKDKSYLTIFETLFRLISKEKASFLKATKGPSKTIPESRLNSYAEVFRFAVESTVSRLRLKTFRALIDHIVQILPTGEGGFCLPLSFHYFKALAILTDYAPHVEHLRQETWIDAVETCLAGLVWFTGESQSRPNTPPGDRAASGNASFRSRYTSFPSSQPRSNRPEDWSSNVEALLQSLSNLTKASNAPLHQKSKGILTAVLGFLEKSASAKGNLEAFETLNAIISWTSLQSISLTRESLGRLIPIIKSLWTNKETELKDEMLKSLLICQPFLSVNQTPSNLDFLSRNDLGRLFETLFEDYVESESRKRRHLSMNELGFGTRRSPFSVIGMRNCSITLRANTQDAEHSWTLLHVLASLAHSIDSFESAGGNYDDLNDFENSRKRQKTSSKFEDIFSRSYTANALQRIHTLQLCAFLMNENSNVTLERLQYAIKRLMRSVAHPNAEVSSWAMLALSSCATIKESSVSNTHLKDLWLNVWQSAFRLLDSVPHCRAASHLLSVLMTLHRVYHEDIKESLDVLVNYGNVNGPAMACDSALSLWSGVRQIILVHSGLGNEISKLQDQLLSWTASKWTPSNFENRSYAIQISRSISVIDLIEVFGFLPKLGDCSSSRARFCCAGNIGQIWLQMFESERLMNYLISQDVDDFQLTSASLGDGASSTVKQPKGADNVRLDSRLLDNLMSEMDKTMDAWRKSVEAKQKNVSADMVQLVFSLYFLSEVAAQEFSIPHSGRAESTRKKSIALGKMIFTHIASAETESSAVDGIFDIIAPFMPIHLDSLDIFQQGKALEFLGHISQRLYEALESRDQAVEERQLDEAFDEDIMDIDTGSQPHKVAEGPSKNLRREAVARSCAFSFTSSIHIFLNLISTIALSEDLENSTLLPSSATDLLIDLPLEKLLASKPVLNILRMSNLQYAPQDAERLLEHVAQNFLEDYNYERCEVAIGLCIDLMIQTISSWTDPGSEILWDIGSQVYTWLVEKVFASISSSYVQTSISDLLFALLRTQSDYVPGNSQPSVRTTLLRVLSEGSLAVKYHFADELPSLFNMFVLDQHTLILDDIRGKLPTNAEWIEGMAMRLLVFAKLGSEWHNLLRHCVFFIFEAAGDVKDSVPYAKASIQLISRSYHLENSRTIFRLFQYQLLYTWVAEKSLSSIPWMIFEYSDLSELLEDCRDEIVSQMMMRGDERGRKELQDLLESSEKGLVRKSFGQTTAYAFASDVAPAVSQRELSSNPEKPSHQVETRIRDILGKQEFYQLLRERFPYVIGHMFRSLTKENQIEKALAKSQGYRNASNVFKTIKGSDALDDDLPESQRPCFKTKFLLDDIERVCRRISKDPAQIWDASLVCVVSRMILDGIHPVLGSLHARREIQRLRIVVCLSGQTALKGYPLQLLLHALRPYTTDSRCAQDSLGLFQYLLASGKDDLKKHPSFVSGTCLAVSLSMRKLLKSTQDSTTQESHHKAILSKAERFHKWLSQYLAAYDPTAIHPSTRKIFMSLIEKSQIILRSGNSTRDSPESSLLVTLLADLRLVKPVLSKAFFALCFRLFTEDFYAPEHFADDAFAEDQNAAKLVVQVWKSCQVTKVSTGYLSWAARVIGQSFHEQGRAPPAILRESRLSEMKTLCSTQDSLAGSTTAIMKVLLQMLQNEHSPTVGLAEKALRSMLFKTRDTDEGLSLANALPEDVAEGLRVDKKTIAPQSQLEYTSSDVVSQTFQDLDGKMAPEWAQNLTLALIFCSEGDPIAEALLPACQNDQDISEQLFPFILHNAIEWNVSTAPRFMRNVSDGFNHCFSIASDVNQHHMRILLNAILYLRTRPARDEATYLDRNLWLNVDFESAAIAAQRCKMLKTALLLLEIGQSLSFGKSRRSSSSKLVPNDLLLSIYREMEDLDSYLGVFQPPGLDSIADRLSFEGNITQEMLLRGAQSDSMLRNGLTDESKAFVNVINSMSRLNLSSVAHKLFAAHSPDTLGDSTVEAMTKSALKLRQWDLSLPTDLGSNSSIIYQSFQSASKASDRQSIYASFETGILNIFQKLQSQGHASQLLQGSLAALAALAESYEVMSLNSSSELLNFRPRFEHRRHWMKFGRLEDVSTIVSTREALLGMLSDSDKHQRLLHVSQQSSRLLEVETNINSSCLLRSHGSLQEALANVTYLSDLIKPCESIDLRIDSAVQQEIANVLWEQGDIVPSIRMLQAIESSSGIGDQSIHVGRAGLLATLGNHVSEARLERPDDILNKYLSRAQSELKGKFEGNEAGHVFHEFASYCHTQLKNPDNVEEFERSERFKDKRSSEVAELEALLKDKCSEEQKARIKSDRSKARKWLDIDRAEYERLNQNREQFLRQSLENYLLALAASDEHDTDVVNFVALWLEYSTNAQANDTVSRIIGQVPSRKFASLMNQLASRLQENGDLFNMSIAALVERVCIDHPFHGMYHIYAGSQSKGGSDRVAMSRHAAASKIAKRLNSNTRVAKTWNAASKANELYIRLAAHKSDITTPGARIPLSKLAESKAVQREVPGLDIPPITMTVELMPDCDYSGVPTVQSFRPDMSIAGGISTPKVLTAIASNGANLKQLFKSGSDDLRQDAIMEQVFEEVSNMLQRNKATRQRDLRIRTYRVVPLTASAGAIEFVQDTVSLNDYLRPAHARYNPRDLKWDLCRTRIDDYRSKSLESRIKTYKDLADRFHPVLRHFFFEKYEDPDDWYWRRMAYTRSTAAISILGHTLGLGDRHCQNILLDVSSGEVVHIDLGVAFEAGRILQVPEVVPFRLTRDVVDGFGIMGTEGVFRRCCEFTLEALRKNKDAIMTLLNVLRYDPLYNWSMSPLRAKRLQDEQQLDLTPVNSTKSTRQSHGGNTPVNEVKKSTSGDDEVGEADRALSVVEKKLAPGLSVMATVNELIQQATDEKNLAVLFCGWAAFA